MERYLGGEDNRRGGADRGSGEGRRPRLVLPRHPGVQRHRRRHPRTARSGHPRLPVTARAPAARGVHPARRRATATVLRPGRPAAGRGGQDDVGPLRRQGQPGPGLLRNHQARRDSPCVGPFFGLLRQRTARPTPTTTRTSASARCRSRWASSSGRPAPWSPATSARSAGSPGRDRGHVVGQGRSAGAQAVDDARAAAADRDRSRTPRPTRTSCRSGCSGWPPRTRRCGSSRTRRPTRSCCGAWARRTRRGARRAGQPVRRERRHHRRASPAAGDLRWPAKGHGRHVKQSGGHGQYAVCDIEVEPLPEGAGFEFVDKVVGGSVPRQFIPSVEKGVRAQMEKGVARRATRWSTSGSRSSTARRTASTPRTWPSRWPARLALREAAARDPGVAARAGRRGRRRGARRPRRRRDGRPVRRRGRVLGTEKVGESRTVIKAEVPQVELTRYAIDLRQPHPRRGRRSPGPSSRYEPMPEPAAAKVKSDA